MKTSRYLTVFSLTLLSLIITSCSIIGDIFKTGMGVGIFIVVAIIVLVLVLLMRSGKGQS